MAWQDLVLMILGGCAGGFFASLVIESFKLAFKKEI